MQAISMNLRTAAEATGLSVIKLRQLIKRKQLRASRVGKRLVVSTEDIQKMLAKNATK
jgi:excisionase family DNA binding protein